MSVRGVWIGAAGAGAVKRCMQTQGAARSAENVSLVMWGERGTA
jgi:hypothetical protein